MYKLLKPFLAIGDALVKRVLRSRIHWALSGNMVMLELTGRKSGQIYLVPVNYRPFEGGISIMTYRRRQWWRNIQSGTELPVYLRGKRTITMPEVITKDIEAIEAALVARGWVLKSAVPAKAKDSVLIRLHMLT